MDIVTRRNVIDMLYVIYFRTIIVGIVMFTVFTKLTERAQGTMVLELTSYQHEYSSGTNSITKWRSCHVKTLFQRQQLPKMI
jgi:hypothetical protein